MQIVKLKAMRSSPLLSCLISLRPEYFFSNLFSNTFSLLSSLNVRDQLPHQYKTNGQNCSSVYLNIYIAGW